MAPADEKRVLEAQRNELTEAHIYNRLAERVRGEPNRKLLRRIAADEQGHHDLLARATGRRVRPKRAIILWYLMLARILGVTFALKLMERGEETAQVGYRELADVPGIEGVIADEEQHERELIDMLDDERLAYAGSVVLGLNDALVELTGALAGLTLALSQARLVAMAGLVTGIAASLSMAASEYLSRKSEMDSEAESAAGKSPLKAAVYTGVAYIFAVSLLILPYFMCANLLLALTLTLSIAVVIIAVFNGYLAVARDLRFWPRFLEMAAISLGVAALSFGIGYLVRRFMGIDAP